MKECPLRPSPIEHAFIKAELKDKVKTVVKQASCVDRACSDRLTPDEIKQAVQEALYEIIREVEKT